MMENLLYFSLIIFILATLVGWWAHRKGKRFLLYFLLSYLITPLVSAIALLVDIERTTARQERKKLRLGYKLAWIFVILSISFVVLVGVFYIVLFVTLLIIKLP